MGQYASTVASDGSGRFDAYLVLPASGEGPDVVIGQEIFGVNANTCAIANLYAEEGYVVLVPDLSQRLQPDADLDYNEAAFARAIELFQRVDLDAAMDDIAACIERLCQCEEMVHAGVGSAGFRMGGKLAYLVMARTDVSCSMGYYGMGIETLLDEMRQIKDRLALHFVEQGAYCLQQARDAVLPRLRNLPKTELYPYPGVDYAFARIGGVHFGKPAYLVAHERGTAALKREIRSDFDFSAL